MAVLSIARVETRSDHTPPATPQSNQGPQPTELTIKTCGSKSCINKMDKVKTKEHKKSTKEKPVSSSEDSSSTSSDTSEQGINSSSESEPKRSRRKSKTKSKKLKKSKKSMKEKKEVKKESKDGKSAKTKTDEAEDKVKDEEKMEGDSQESNATVTSASDGMSALKSNLDSQGFDMSDKHNRKVFKLFLQSLTKKAGSKDESTDSDGSDTDEREKKKKIKRASRAEFKRLDEIWDTDAYAYKLKETSDGQKIDEFEEFIFTVRRKFDNEGHYEETTVDINSQPLKECLQHVLADVEGLSLMEDTPHMMPRTLFLFIEEFRQYAEQMKEERENAEKRKARKLAGLKEKHLKKLVEYLDVDFDDTKKTLYPLLKSGRITFDLLWALYKPNTLAVTSTYGDDDHPRAYKIEAVFKHSSFSRGTYYEISGKYLDYNGKHFGSANYAAQVSAFQGTRKISSLICYPLEHHADAEKLKISLLERGKRFLTLAGQHYQSCRGMAYAKKNDKPLKVNVNGRIMIDAGTFRRINPNYPVADVELRKEDLDDRCSCEEVTKVKGPLFRLLNPDKEPSVVAVESKEHNTADSADVEDDIGDIFTEEELLVASPVVLGFSFSEKCWLEFSVSSIADVKWNDGAFDSLVLPEQHKSIVKALVSAHGLHSAKGFDDIIAGKGKGLVAVLHGRPGLGKTLTCEAVSDLLKRPLYTVSAGDLGTCPTQLEAELQAILDIAHTWNAVLLLDEADVFLEERSLHDVHRNALVSIFLRLLEYFQGILFLTTNRVAIFDEAFVSRIHLSLRYSELTFEAKRSVWKTFIDKVRVMEGTEVGSITERDFNVLARHDMNGRQIKNMVKTAQALALHEGKPMGMEHVNRVIDVAKSFEMDLKGGSGYSDALRSYS